jgi:rhodanese-related sulfurtransferase
MRSPNCYTQFIFLALNGLLAWNSIGCVAIHANPANVESLNLESIDSQYANDAKKFPEVRGISVQTLQYLQTHEEVVLVDVRSPQEQYVAMIPGAISVAEFERDRQKYSGFAIIPYCTVGYRSGLYAQKLQQQGWQVFNLEGGILAWNYLHP